jgi:hypothetical protein
LLYDLGHVTVQSTETRSHGAQVHRLTSGRRQSLALRCHKTVEAQATVGFVVGEEDLAL